MLEIVKEAKGGTNVIRLKGDVLGSSVGDLLRCWHRVRVESPSSFITLDLSQVASVDVQGARILDFMLRKGTTLVRC